ncbi:hypothetical protein Tdes44962_MAKER01788 [Teratosphaeria destructans]|uniref:Uncharacterized protein n=1 Tax=Teratosphaeria destructans TaxID=418781 RepID=A0A9W7W5C8_9PEZI|nr:hypothetical protein Tdes44962_MAKER01788 [Teratosphaeria destructans]
MGKRSRSNSEVSESQPPARRSRRLASQEPEVLQHLPTTTRKKRDIKRAKKPAPAPISKSKSTKSKAAPPPPPPPPPPSSSSSSAAASPPQDQLPAAESLDTEVLESPEAEAEPETQESQQTSEPEHAPEPAPAPAPATEPSQEPEVVQVIDIETTSPPPSPPEQFEPDLTVVEEEQEDIVETLPVFATPTPLPAWRRYGGYLTSAVSRLSPFARPASASQPTLQAGSRPNSRSSATPPAESAQRPAVQPTNNSTAVPTSEPASHSPPSPLQTALRAILDRSPSPFERAGQAAPSPEQPVVSSVETPLQHPSGTARKRAAEEENPVTSKRAKTTEPVPTFKPTPRFSTQRPKVVKNPQRRNRSVSRESSVEPPYSQPPPMPEKWEWIHLFKSPPPPRTEKRKVSSSEAEPARAPTEKPPPEITVDRAPTNAPTPAPAKTATPAQSTKRTGASEDQSAVTKTPAPTPSLKRKAPIEERPTPKVAKTPFLMPSTKRPGTVSSLTPVTEANERSRISLASENTPAQPIYTPSHPPATAPTRQRRSISKVRAARLAPQSAKRAGPYAWELAAAERERSRDAVSISSSFPPPPWNTPLPTAASSVRPAKPREANADARYAKLERLRKLEMELALLREDEDIKEMEGHRMKRVKVDHLEYIPHKKPGDSEGTFRVPDWDSDDEMEVEESVPVRANIFDDDKDISTPVPAAPASIAPAPASVGASTAPAPASVPATPAPVSVSAVPAPAPVPAVAKPRKWNFPDLGQRGESPSPGYKARAKAKFEAGFAAWKEQKGIIEV